MIVSFKSKETEKVFNGNTSLKLPNDIQRIAMRKLWMIHAAVSLNDLRIPFSNNLEILKGKRKGQRSIRINNRWRICFKWEDTGVADVEIVDYH